MTSIHNEIDRFRLTMTPVLWTGIATNIYICFAVLWVGAFDVIYSPLAGLVIFSALLITLTKKILKAKAAFLIASYTVFAEVVIHTHYLGWESSFSHFLFLLPLVFLLYAKRSWLLIYLFNGSLLILAGLFIFFYLGWAGIHPIDPFKLQIISVLNIIGTGAIIIIIMIYFSRKIHKKDQEVLAANLILEKQNIEIKSQHTHLQILIKEIHHRVKNNLQIISSLLSMQQRSITDKEVAKVLTESKRRVEAIALIHQKLYQDENVNKVNFKSYIEEMMDSQKIVNPELNFNIKANEVVISLDIAVPLGLILSEMVSNSSKHAFQNTEEPFIEISLVNIGKDFELIVKDNGIGMPEEFDIEVSGNLGMTIISALIDQIDAKMTHQNNNGAQFNISFTNDL